MLKEENSRFWFKNLGIKKIKKCKKGIDNIKQKCYIINVIRDNTLIGEKK